jgi:cobalt-zinc-cadmium efflux system membrane fusion protein
VNRKLLALALLLSVAAAVVLAHEGHAPLPSKGAQVDLAKGHVILTAEARHILDVGTAEIGTAPPPDTVLAYATLTAPWTGHAFAVSRMPGRVVKLHARPGDRVEAGGVLAEVQSQELEAVRADVLASRTAVRLADELHRTAKDSPGTVAGKDVRAAAVQLRQAQDALELAGAKWLALGLSRATLDALGTGAEPPLTLPIRAPVGGTVIHADLSVGKVVEPGEHLFEIVAPEVVWARVGVLEKDIPRVAPGLAVEVRLTAYPGETFRGAVAVVGKYLDPETHLNDVWVEFRNPPGREPRLLPGMYGQARIELAPAAGTKVVPASALVDDGVDRFVLVEEASAAGASEFRKKSVVVVREAPDVVEVRSPDLYPGDRVVVRGGHELGTFFVPGVLRLSPESAKTIGLTVAPASLRTVEQVVDVPGAIDLPPDRRTTAAARLGGTIVALRTDRGREVNAGDTLAEVFSLDFIALQLDLLREHLAADLAAEELAQARAAGAAVARVVVAEGEATHAAAVTRRDTARRRLAQLGLTDPQLAALVGKREVVPALPVRAASAGTVVRFDRVVGQNVRADEPLFEVHDLARPWVQGFVSEQELPRVRVGMPARVRLLADAGEQTGKVVRSGRTFGATHRTLSVWVELDRDPPAPLRHNQTARLALTAGSPPPSLAVPLGAVVRDGTRAFVFVQTGDTFDRREVRLGRADDRFAEVTAGLKTGEPVAVAGAEALNTAWASVR